MPALSFVGKMIRVICQEWKTNPRPFGRHGDNRNYIARISFVLDWTLIVRGAQNRRLSTLPVTNRVTIPRVRAQNSVAGVTMGCTGIRQEIMGNRLATTLRANFRSQAALFVFSSAKRTTRGLASFSKSL